ncbi:MAG: MmcQ/YjbR family DNA-binding protein [Clostridia bacterium]|nr:MmcQ/YjbR family DNA-binding protein [Clostridia bacterium]
MTRSEFEELVFDRYGVRADYPFEEDFVTGVFRHSDGKWFAIAMQISEKRLGRDGNEEKAIVNLKCAPEVIESLVGNEPGIYPAYHMNKTHWLTLALSDCDGQTVDWLLSGSYELTKRRKKCANGRRKGYTCAKN